MHDQREDIALKATHQLDQELVHAERHIAAVAVELDDAGRDVVVVQKADRQFQPGQKVRLIGSGSNVSVAPY
jgi:outer membrane lipoprotein SlyB